MRQMEAHITSANINPSARTGNIRTKSRRDPWCPAASSNSPLTISFTAQPACRHLPLLPMKGVQPASLLRLLYLLYNMNCRGLNPATRRHLSQRPKWRENLIERGGVYWLKFRRAIVPAAHHAAPDAKFVMSDVPPWTGKRRAIQKNLTPAVLNTANLPQ